DRIASTLINFIDPDNKHKAELIVHNALFTTNFIDYEMFNVDKKWATIYDCCSRVIDTLEMARELHPAKAGNSNYLDALGTRYNIKNGMKNLPTNYYDAENRANLVMKVYLKMKNELEKQNQKNNYKLFNLHNNKTHHYNTRSQHHIEDQPAVK